MAGKRDNNIRSGDLAEQQALLLLQNLALVSPVPRTEDVGIDAVVTLLNKVGNRNLMAKDSFFIQIKSSTVNKITYSKEEVNWLFSLELPFFIVSSNKIKQEIELFACHRLAEAFITNAKRSKITLYLENEENAIDGISAEEEEIKIGPPVFTFGLSDIISNESFLEKFYNIVSAHIKFMKSNIVTRNVGWIDGVVWKTNEIPHHYGWHSAGKGNGIELDADGAFYQIMPFLQKLWNVSAYEKNIYYLKQLIILTQKNIELIETRSKPDEIIRTLKPFDKK